MATRRKGRKAPSAAQRANQERFAAMARARAGRGVRRVGAALTRSASVGRSGGSDMIGTVIGGGMDAVWIVGGKVASRAAPALLRLDAAAAGGAMVVAAVQIGAGLAASMLAGQFISRDAARLVFAGTAVGLLETAARRFELPYVSTLVGDEGDVLGGYTYEVLDTPANAGMLGLYPGGGPGLGLYPSTVGSYVYE